MIIVKLLMFFVISFYSASVLSADDWALSKDEDGVRVYLRNVAESEFREFKGITKIKTSVDSLVAVLDDTKACPEWFFQCKNPIEVFRSSFNDRYKYQVNDLPIIASDRDILFHMMAYYNQAEQSALIKIESAADYCNDKSTEACKAIKQSQLVRVKELVGYFLFKPLADGWVEVTWQQYLLPAGDLPAWMVNAMLVDFPLNTLKSLNKMAKRDKYKNAQLTFDSKGQMSGFNQVISE